MPESTATSVVFINTLIPPPGGETTFLAWWRMAAPFLRLQPGFIAARLHRSLDGDKRRRFVTVVEWESAQAYTKALDAMMSAVPRPNIPGMELHPALYEVVERIER